MIKNDPILEIKNLAAQAGMNISELFCEADVSLSNWSRWKNKRTSPNTATVDKLKAAAAKRIKNTKENTGKLSGLSPRTN